MKAAFAALALIGVATSASVDDLTINGANSPLITIDFFAEPNCDDSGDFASSSVSVGNLECQRSAYGGSWMAASLPNYVVAIYWARDLGCARVVKNRYVSVGQW